MPYSIHNPFINFTFKINYIHPYIYIGASYTPEYYINMRTGTHYFPSRGVSSAAVTIEQSRQKFGLNKIDEATPPPSDALPIVHRRTESCDIGRRNSMQNCINPLANVGQQNNFQANIVAATGLSPDLQRRLALQNYKGLECRYSSFWTVNHLCIFFLFIRITRSTITKTTLSNQN